MPGAIVNPAGSQQGIEVVHPYYKITKGLPAAIVRSYKEPVYDTVMVTAAAPATERVLYQRPVGQTLEDNATVKTELHTNMSNAAQLGSPKSFDIYGFNGRLEEVGNKIVVVGNFDNFFGAAVVIVRFGDTDFLTVPAEDIPAGVDTEGLGATDAPHIGVGNSDNVYRFDVGGRSIHINPTENFRTTLRFPSGLAGITGNHLYKWFMRGIQYRGV